MPVDQPKHNDPITYDKGKWVPVGWKPLNPSARTRQLLMHIIAKKKLEAHDKESQRNAQKKKKEEKREAKKRAVEELEKTEQELKEHLAQREKLAELKHNKFAELKSIIQRQSQLKKIEEEKRKKEEALNQMLNPQAYTSAINKPAVQSNSLISQQFLHPQPQIPQYQPNTSSNFNLIHQQLLQSLSQPSKPQQQQQQQLQAQLTKQLLHPQSSHTPQMRSQLIPPPAPSPFSSYSSNYASPVPSNRSASFTVPQHQALNSPRRDRPSMVSPGMQKYATPQSQARHNTFSGGSRPTFESLRPPEMGSPAIQPASSQLTMPGLSALAGMSTADMQQLVQRSGLLQQQQLQHQHQQLQQLLPQHSQTAHGQGFLR